MKNINNYIQERLVINSKTKTNHYTCQPKDKDELRKILRERLDKDKNADLNNIDVSKIIDMSHLFCFLNPCNINISEWDVSNVENMCGMFWMCEEFNCNLSNWDVSNVEDMTNMFYDCYNFDGKGLEKWNISKLEGYDHMFNNCRESIIPQWYKNLLRN